MKILIVDDQTFIREAIKSELVGKDPLQNFIFFEADCGNSAITLLEQSALNTEPEFDLIITDLKMENGDGLAIINYMATTKSKNIPLVIVSSSDQRTLDLIGNITNSFNLNLVGVFQKPLNVNEVLNLLNNNQFIAKEVLESKAEQANCNSANIASLLNEDNLFLCYQPKVDIKSNKLIGFEVLSRLTIQGDGFIYPDKFIPLIEQAGLNCQFTKLVLDQAISHWQLFPALKQYGLSINISASDLLSEELINHLIAKHLAASDIQLMLELTESQHTINQERSLQAIAKLIINDIPISLDDFGKSYSTFDRLDSIPFEEIKIDKDFVSDLDSNLQHQAIVESTIALAKKLNVKVVAEGVETLGVLNRLQLLGCHTAQGYYFSPPIEGRYLMTWVNDYNHQNEVKNANH